jgi:hypothetical protein
MWNWIGAFGVLIEFVGFLTLAYEIWKTSKMQIFETISLSAKPAAFDRITVGSNGGMVEGGIIGEQIESIRRSELKLRERLNLILRGLFFTAAGSALQVIGGFGQVLQNP